MDIEKMRHYVADIVDALDHDGSYREGGVVIWVAADGYWVGDGNGAQHGFGWERPAALWAFLHKVGG